MTDGQRDGPAEWVVVLAVGVVALGAIVPVIVEARPANEVPISDLSGEDDALERPNGSAWDETTPATVSLASAPSQAPEAEDTTTEEMSVRTAYTDDRLYVRLSWSDASGDRDLDPHEERTPHGDSFPDAAAVQLPVNESADPGIAMGSEREPVNVWYWRADQGSHEVLAGGPGTTTALNDSAIDTEARYDDGRWAVVFARDLVVGEGGDRLAVEMDDDVNVAFGVWNGSNTERAGQKAVSEWQYVPLGPGAQGPPYAAILWAIAGLSVVVVLVATAVGVSRSTGGGGA